MSNPKTWGQSFEFLIRSEDGVGIFKKYLKGQFCDENLDFWLAVENYRNNLDDCELEKQSGIIVKTYVSKRATRAVNLKAPNREKTVKAVEADPHRNVFDDAQKEIYDFMQRDPYVRFLKSDEYKNACQ
ncbi:regulator of G-protein signaling 1-like [Argonauta hians]